MANKRNYSKKKKNKKNKKINVFLVIIVLLIIVGLSVFIVYPSYNKSLEASKVLETISTMFDDSIPSITENDLNFFSYDNDFFTLSWETSNKSIIDNEGKCNRPLYKDGNTSVLVTLNVNLKDLSIVDKIVFNTLNVSSKDLEKKVNVISLPKSDLDKVNEILNSISIPQIILESFTLPKDIAFYPDMSLTWVSDDESILTSKGEKKGLGKTSLNVTVALGNEKMSKSYLVECVDEVILEEVNYDFSDYDDTTYEMTTYDYITLNSSLANNEMVKFKVSEENAYFETIDKVTKPKRISFSYKILDTDLSFTKNSYIKLMVSDDKISYKDIYSEIINDANEHTFSFDFVNDYAIENTYLKVLITSEYKTIYVSIDNLLIQRSLNKDDIINSISLPQTIKENILLPFTTSYGGSIEYEIQSSALNSDGIISQKENSQEVAVKVKVNGFEFEIQLEKVVKVVGTKEVVPVEIRFIDVGKYGHSDCGESILIKYGDIEVLIDAGDRYDDTFKAVSEVINNNCQDKVLEYVIATHPDSDHIGSMDDVINTYKVENIIRFMGDSSSNIYKSFNEAVNNEEDCNVCYVLDSYNNVGTCKRIINLGDDVYIEIINTQNYEQKENNARSVVCVLNAYGVRTLFTGDADNNSSELEKAYMNTVGDVDILKIVHHGTANGTTTDFLKAVTPETVIVCNGNYFGNKHGHPTYEALSRIYEVNQNTQVYAVVGGDSDNCNLTSSGSYKCEPTDYMQDRNGTILITIDNTGYALSSEYNGTDIIEIRETEFWKERSKVN